MAKSLRKRWLGRSAIAAVGILVCWWWLTLPSVDQRFVGHWKSILAGRKNLEWTFLSNGVLEAEWHLYPREKWSVRGDQLIVTPKLDLQNTGALIFDVQRWRVPASTTYTILEVRENVIRLQNGKWIILLERLVD